MDKQYIEDENHPVYALLEEAYLKLDTGLLQSAIDQGADINLSTERLPFGIYAMLEPFTFDGENDEPFPDEITKKWYANKSKVIEMLSIAVDNGLLMNECSDIGGGVYYPILSFQTRCPDDMEFVDWLIDHGFDPVHVYDVWPQFQDLTEMAESAFWDEEYNYCRWLLKLCIHLMDRFPELHKQYDHKKLLEMTGKLT